MTCFSLILISNNTELAAKYLPNKERKIYKGRINLQNINENANDLKLAFDVLKKNNLLIVDNTEQII